MLGICAFLNAIDTVLLFAKYGKKETIFFNESYLLAYHEEEKTVPVLQFVISDCFSNLDNVTGITVNPIFNKNIQSFDELDNVSKKVLDMLSGEFPHYFNRMFANTYNLADRCNEEIFRESVDECLRSFILHNVKYFFDKNFTLDKTSVIS